MPKQILSIKKVQKALEDQGGMPTYAAKQLGVTYTGLWRFMKKHPELYEFREAARSKFHEELESLATFALKTGYIQRTVLDKKGKPTSEVFYESVDPKTRLSLAMFIMNQYKGAVGIKDKFEIESKGIKVYNNTISVIELPENLRPKSGSK